MTSITANSSRLSIKIKGINKSLRLTRIQGSESVSGLFNYDICFASKSRFSDLKTLLDKTVSITIHGEQPRHLSGMIHQASYHSHGKEYTEYQIRMVPLLWRLTQRTNLRIFQEKTPNEIIALLLKEHGIQGNIFQDKTAQGSQREYCVQYEESDYDFIFRLMQEEGWHYHFQTSKDKQVLVLADNNSAFKQKTGKPSIRYEQETSRPQDEECIHALLARHTVTGNGVRISDFNFEKPTLGLNESASNGNGHRQIYHHPGLFNNPGAGADLAQTQLEQRQHLAQTSSMSTHSTLCAAGQFFDLTKHPNKTINQRYLIIGSQLDAEQPQSLDEGAPSGPAHCRTELTCILYSTPFRPPRNYHKPRISGPHNAVVTGPAGEDIYTDKYGRIKVQFFWDREGQANETTSCWLRVNQPVAGLQWGGISLPRIGQEVIVEFEHGDPDRPVMIGRVYNDQNKPPYALPSHKTRSTFQSLSSPKGGGYNEFRIEDKKGSEQIFIRAEKDVDLRVLNNFSQQVDNQLHHRVAANQFQQITKDTHLSIANGSHQDTGQSLSLTVGKDMQLKVGGSRIIQAGNSIHIKAGNKAVIQAGSSLSVKAGAGVVTLDGSGVSIMGPLVRINEGGGGSSAQTANPSQPGNPAEADNDKPGKKPQAASGPVTPLPKKLDFDRAAAQLAVLEQARLAQSPLAEDCPECALHAAQKTAAATKEATHAESAKPEDNWVDLYYAHADGQGVAGATYTLYDANTGAILAQGKLDATGQAKVAIPVDKKQVRVEYHSDEGEPVINQPDDVKDALKAPPGWVERMMGKEPD